MLYLKCVWAAMRDTKPAVLAADHIPSLDPAANSLAASCCRMLTLTVLLSWHKTVPNSRL